MLAHSGQKRETLLFHRPNPAGFRKSMKKYDKNMKLRETGQEMAQGMDAKLDKEPFVVASLLDVCLGRSIIVALSTRNTFP